MTSVTDARETLLSRADLDDRGFTSRSIAAAIAAGQLRRVHHGWYVEEAVWRAAYSERRHLLRVIAAHAQQRGTEAVASHTSAAVLHGLPLFRIIPKRVHLSGTGLGGHISNGDIARHETPVPDEDRTVVAGVPCTSLARTMADMIRMAPVEAGLALADAAFRATAWDDLEHTYDESEADALRDEVVARLARVRRARGCRRGRFILDLADGRAQLPGESVSRLYLLQLGFAVPQLQVPIPAPDDRFYYVDLGLDDVDAWGEFDGEGKYLDSKMRGDVTLEEALLAEKAREDWIRGTTGRRFLRWGMPAIASANTLGIRLAKFHIYPPG